MLSCTSSNTFTRGKYQIIPNNLDNPKIGLYFGTWLSIGSLTLGLEIVSVSVHNVLVCKYIALIGIEIVAVAFMNFVGITWLVFSLPSAAFVAAVKTRQTN